MKIIATKPSNGAFVKFDSEGQSEIRLVCDASQQERVKELLDIPYGEVFEVDFCVGNKE